MYPEKKNIMCSNCVTFGVPAIVPRAFGKYAIDATRIFSPFYDDLPNRRIHPARIIPSVSFASAFERLTIADNILQTIRARFRRPPAVLWLIINHQTRYSDRTHVSSSKTLIFPPATSAFGRARAHKVSILLVRGSTGHRKTALAFQKAFVVANVL
ncbi:hypothetical protein SCHPADRAFT_476635 [Schizopora paradoxa]|uniref:Uncharacterized protein n=1 Tax=Schizopora paradoxa TaxID=27342 RepID=A0A0H2RPA7_9AGAM|nr:hypothetical protein SCHPADRAFT_476635 [Schizopora paradoxa]